MSYKYNPSLPAKYFTIDKRVRAICKLDKAQKKSIATFSMLVLPADCRFLFLVAATGLHDDDSTFECSTVECFTL